MAERERDAALQICRAAAIVEAAAPRRRTRIALRTLPHEPIEWGPNPPSLLKLTSGTTAAPRAIRFRSEQLLADCTQICETMGITGRDLNFAVIPLSHSYGFSNLITPLLARGVPMVLSRDRMPRAVLDDLARSKRHRLPGNAGFLSGLLRDGGRAALASSCGFAFPRARRLPLEVARKFRQKFKQPIHSFYGSSECGGICYDRDALLLEPGFVGQPMRGVDLELLEPDAPATPRASSKRRGRGRLFSRAR